MREAMLRVLGNYLQAKAEPFRSHPFAHEFVYSLANAVRREVDTHRYTVFASVGKGRWAEVPWIGVFDKSVTSSAQDGIYVVYLFAADMSGVYLSLNQGWTRYEEQFGLAAGRKKAREAALSWRRLTMPHLGGLSPDDIDLKSRVKRPVGYMAGHICGQYYPCEAMPSHEDLRADLAGLLVIYRRLVSLLRHQRVDFILDRLSDPLLQSSVDDPEDDRFQRDVSDSLPSISNHGPKIRPQPVVGSSGLVWPRDPSVAREALIRAAYLCEADPAHKTFVSSVTGQNYVEAHHLIPMSRQGEVNVSLDVVANIVSLCPTCHRAIHHAEAPHREDLADSLLRRRRFALGQCGIDVDALSQERGEADVNS